MGAPPTAGAIVGAEGGRLSSAGVAHPSSIKLVRTIDISQVRTFMVIS
jgi:hypothetical protein